MNTKHFVFDILDRVLAREKRLRFYYGRSGCAGGLGDVSEKDRQGDASAICLMQVSVRGITRLDDDALSCLHSYAAYDTLLTAGRKGMADRDSICEYLLALGKYRRISISGRLNALKVRASNHSVADCPLDDFGHGPRWYAKLFARIRPRQASDYVKLDAVLKRLGYPKPEERDAEGLMIDDYLKSVLPGRAEYLALEFPASKEGLCEIRYLNRAAGEMLARANEKSSRLLFRLIDGGRYRRDAYLGVFPLTRKQVWSIKGGMGIPPRAGDIPWTAFSEYGDVGHDGQLEKYVLVCDRVVQSLRKLTGFASVEIPESGLWERACRAGTSTRFNGGSNDEMSCLDLGWTAVNGGLVPHPVGLKLPNALGLYDCHGNVSECCWKRDRDGLSYVTRGGSCKDMPSGCTSQASVLCGNRGTCGLRPAIYL